MDVWICACTRAKSLQSCLTLCDLAMFTSRESSWSRTESTSLTSPALACRFFITSATG